MLAARADTYKKLQAYGLPLTVKLTGIAHHYHAPEIAVFETIIVTLLEGAEVTSHSFEASHDQMVFHTAEIYLDDVLDITPVLD